MYSTRDKHFVKRAFGKRTGHRVCFLNSEVEAGVGPETSKGICCFECLCRCITGTGTVYIRLHFIKKT